MEESEQYHTPSREEYIKLARENCSKNLGTWSRGTYDSDINARKKQDKLESLFLRRKKGSGRSLSGQLLSKSFEMRMFLLRTVVAIVLFLFFVLMQKFDLNILSLTTELIEESVVTNQNLEEAEKYIENYIFKW